MKKMEKSLKVSPKSYLFSRGIQVSGEGWEGPVAFSLKGNPKKTVIIEQCLEGALHKNWVLPKRGKFLVKLRIGNLKEASYELIAIEVKTKKKVSDKFVIKRGGEIDKKSGKPNHRWLRRIMHHNRVRFGDDKNRKPGSRLEALAHRDKMRIKKHRLLDRIKLFPNQNEPGTPVDPGCNWHCIGPSVVRNGQVFGTSSGTFDTNHISGRITSIAIDANDPDCIYIGAAQGGVWKSENEGRDWCAISDYEASLAIGCVTVDPSVVVDGRSQRIFVGTGEPNGSDSYYGSGILFSDDGGDTWVNRASVLFNRDAFSTIKVDPSNNQHLYAATDVGLYESTDEGVNWTLLESGTFFDLIVNFGLPEGDELIVGRFGVGIRRSQDGGATFTTLSSGLPASFGRIALAQAPSDSQTIYAAFSDGFGGLTGMFITTDGGATWTSIGNPAGTRQTGYNFVLAVDPSDVNKVIFGEVELWRTTNGGTSWNRISPNVHADQHAVAYHPTNANKVYLGNDGGFFFSTDNGATWDHRNKGLATLQYYGFGQHPSLDAVILGGTQDNGAQRYLGHPAWEHSALGDGAFAAIDFSDTTKFYESRWWNFPSFRSDAAGNPGTWQNKKTGITTDNNWFYPPLVMDPNNSNVLYTGYDGVWRTSNNADNWTDITGSLSGGSNVTAITVAPSNSNILYAGLQNGRVFRVTFSGGSWSAIDVTTAALTAGQISDIAIHPTNPNIVYVTTSNLIFSEAAGEFTNDHVFRTDNGGSTDWVAVVTGLTQDNPINSICIDPDNPTTLFIGADIGIFRSDNEGANWYPWDEGIPNCSIQDIQFFGPKRLVRAATHGRSIWERPADAGTCPLSDVYMRDNHLDTALTTPPPSGVQHPYVPTKTLHWWQSADIKIDAPDASTNLYTTPGLNINYIDFEELTHNNPRRDTYVRVFAQVHNRGVEKATDIKVRAFFADASAGLPALPTDFWSSFPSGTPTDLSVWRPVGPTQTISEIKQGQPEMASWSWLVPSDVADHTCMICIIESTNDALTTSALDVGDAVRFDNNVSLKNLHVDDFIMGASGSPAFIGPYVLNTDFNKRYPLMDLRINPGNLPLGTNIHLVLPKFEIEGNGDWLKLWKPKKADKLPLKISKQGNCLQEPLKFEKSIFSLKLGRQNLKHLSLNNIHPKTKRFGVSFWLELPEKGIKPEQELHFDMEQWSKEELIGGSTYEIKVKKYKK